MRRRTNATHADAAGEHHAQHREWLRGRFLDSPEAIADYELLELLLSYSIERIDVKPLAKALLAEFRGLGAVVAADPGRLLAHKRVGEWTLALFKAVRETTRRLLREELADRPLISAWSQLLDYCRVSLAEEPTELFRVLYLDRKNRLIRDELQQRGTVDHAPARGRYSSARSSWAPRR